MSHLVIDVGTSSIRTCVVHPDASVTHERRVAMLPATPFPGLVEFDPLALAESATAIAREVLGEVRAVASLGITNQRASTIVWDAATGLPVGPGLGWQDLRTLGDCLTLKTQGISMPPNATGTKVAHLIGLADPERRNEHIRFGTIDSWLLWYLTEGAVHVTDATNAGVTGLAHPTGSTIAWAPELLRALNIPEWTAPRIVDSSGEHGIATRLGGVPVTALLGDQQASLIGQGCVRDGDAKATFGTGGMLDIVGGTAPSGSPGEQTRQAHGSFPVVAHQLRGTVAWATEAVMLSAGACVEWLRDDLGVISTAQESGDLAARCDDTDGVMFVPALLGLGTPNWDFGARGTLLGLTRGTGRAEIVRAVLEGVAHRGADLLDAAAQDSGRTVSVLRIDGGMSANDVFVQALADATQCVIEVSSQREATALGAGLLAGVATRTWDSLGELASTWQPSRVFEPRALDGASRERWQAAVERSTRWIPALSELDF